MKALSAEDVADLRRWLISGAVVVLAHGAIAAGMVNWRDEIEPGGARCRDRHRICSAAGRAGCAASTQRAKDPDRIAHEQRADGGSIDRPSFNQPRQERRQPARQCRGVTGARAGDSPGCAGITHSEEHAGCALRDSAD